MSVIYSWIGIWALLDPVAGALDLGWPSFSVAIGLSVTSEIGYSEIAGIYGGLNFCIGLQWHPEFLIEESDKLVYKKFLEVAKK